MSGGPAEAPPSYSAAISQADNSNNSISHATQLQVPSNADSTSAYRRSMEDESRPLPPGWERHFDAKSHHQFYVDTLASPPHSIWHHPYDDENFLRNQTVEEQQRIAALHTGNGHHAMTSDDEYDHEDEIAGSAAAMSGSKKKETVGQKMKDKLTGSTHAEREAKRAQRAKAERDAQEMHRRFRAAMSRAMQSGEPQLLGKDKDGHDLYVEPPQGPGVATNQFGEVRQVNPWQGPYNNPNARFIRPEAPYQNRGYSGYPGGMYGGYGSGYGGGYGRYGGYGMGMPIMGGLMGGMLLGGMLGGF